MDALWKLLERPCAAIAPGSSCTQRILLHRVGSARVNAMQFWMKYKVGSPACVLQWYHEIPLPPARDIRRQIDAVFGSGARSTQELARQATELYSSSPECGYDPAACTRANDCRASVACVLHGMCASGATCTAQGDECRYTPGCDTSGLCKAISGRCAPRPEAAKGCERECAFYGWCASGEATRHSCLATSPLHCAESLACQRFGACQVDQGRCVPKTSADCASSEMCRERGWCTESEGKCIAASDVDCAQAAVCKSWRACKAVDGLCVSTPP